MAKVKLLTSKLQVHPQDLGVLVEVPFELPIGYQSLSVELIGDIPEDSVLDLGLADPNRVRGWSGGSRSSIFLSLYKATPGYLRGELPRGRWAVLLSPYEITRAFEVVVKIEGDLYCPHWLKSDLHVHSLHSDGCWDLCQLTERAKSAGLDLLALTDHNTISQNVEASGWGFFKNDVLLLPAMEWTTRKGHANVFGLCDPMPDWRVNDDEEFSLKMQEVKNRGALVSINHPYDDFAFGLKWDWSYEKVQFIEIWNGP